MNTQNLYTPHVFHSFSHKCKSHFLQSCSKEFIRFMRDCIVNVFKGNLKSIKKHHVTNFQNVARLASMKRITWKQRRHVLASEKSYNSQKSLLFPSLTSCLVMEQFVFVPASVYNKSLKTQSVTKQELPK